jgi:nucleoside 2-deoxyribosyltransferase
MKHIYFAGPLFSMAEIEFNRKLYHRITEKGYPVFLPQQECQEKEGKDIFETCLHGLKSARLVIANLDGADADSGTCWECGYAFAMGIPIIALRTDFRKSGDTEGFNAMLYYSAEILIDGVTDYESKVLDAIRKVIG